MATRPGQGRPAESYHEASTREVNPVSDPKITSIDLVVFEHQIENMGTDYNGFNQVYEQGGILTTHPTIFRIRGTSSWAFS